MNVQRVAIPEDWQVKTLAALGGQVTSGSRGWAAYYAKHGSLFVRITNLDRSNIQLDLSSSRFVQIDPNDAEARRTQLATGDLLVSITADIGIIGYVNAQVPKPAYINQHIARVRLDPRLVDSRFVAYYLASSEPQRRFVGSTDTGAKAGMNLTTVSALSTVVPPLAEQSRIADVLTDASSHIDALERMIAKKQAIKLGMMQQLLTGRTRLPGYEQEWTDATISSLARVTGGGTPSTRMPAYWGGDIPWFTPAEIRADGSGLVSRSERTITLDGLANSAASLLPPGTVLVTSRATIGNCAVAALPVTTNQGFASMIPKDGRSTWFLYYWTQQNKSELESRAAGSTFLEVSAGKVASIPMRHPDLNEQEAIGQALRDADLELDTLGVRLAKARAIKSGMMQELLTGRTRLPVEEDVA
jgi:type I restriction enzyme S subunit